MVQKKVQITYDCASSYAIIVGEVETMFLCLIMIIRVEI